eukprot:15433779-Alexandrium_andersonii.AAC.1
MVSPAETCEKQTLAAARSKASWTELARKVMADSASDALRWIRPVEPPQPLQAASGAAQPRRRQC